ncbi:MAG: SGNH/GDSL hydrolase family protein [Xanthomonadales bacterium]|jgi:phospholipase/lecithinase/hemolysin|nr:SGNH/GDSL hydrolase family protein [Xanthomonadales bacterium]
MLAVLLLAAAGSAAARDWPDIEINEIVVFGDSLSDTGNVFSLTAFDPSFPVPIPVDPPWFQGRFTNGPVWHEVLSERLAVPSPVPNFQGGLNYAWGGAEYGPGFSQTGVPNVGTQIDWYLTGVPPFPFLPPQAPGTPSGDQLFVINSGNNDLIPPGPPADPRALAESVVEHVSTLAAAGARHFLVLPSLVDETTPGLNPPLDEALFGEVPPAGAVDVIVENAERFNRLLRVKMLRLERQLERALDEPVTITYPNFALAQEIILRRPAWFGFENVSTPAVFVPDDLPPPLGPTCFCIGVVPPGVDPDRYYYFDIVHPTARAHEIFGHLALLNIEWKFAQAHRHLR